VQQAPPGQVGLDQMKVQSFMQRRKAEQSMPLALAAGVIAAIVGAVIWAVVTDMTGYQIGWMAVGVGFLVGYAVQYLGKGIERPFQYVGAICALLGCILGNYFAVAGSVAQDMHVDILTVISRIPLDKAAAVMKSSFQPMDLLFYAIAVYEGYRFSLKRISTAELAALHGPQAT
jgi:hypothetical protein